jgi:hypothetical protein
MSNPEIIIVPVVFAIPAVVLLARMSYRHKEKMADIQGGSPNRQADLEARLDRIEQAVDTIAVEMERIGEGQRFVTKLLAERPSPQQIAEQKSAQRERMTTPH